MNKTYLLVGAYLLAGAASATAQTRPVTLPAQYTALYGSGKAGAAAIGKVLSGTKAARADKVKALEALPYYGEDSAPVLVEFAETVKSDKTWDLPVARSMSGVLDRRLVPKLVSLAQGSADIKVQAQALKGLVSYANCSITTQRVSTPGKSVSFSTVISGSSLDTVHTYGAKPTSEDWNAIQEAALKIKSSANADFRVKALAEGVLSTMARRGKVQNVPPVEPAN